MKTWPRGSIEDRILYNARLSGGVMPICMMVEDEAEKARAVAFCKGKSACRKLSFQTRAERQEIAAELRRWNAAGGAA